jgi:endonuclease VIII
VPEGDALHRAAARLQPLVGQVVAAEARHPRAVVLRVAEKVDGKRLERVEAVGKNLLLTFEGGVVVRSHLRMKGRWWVRPADAPVVGRPWLILRGETYQAVLTGGAVLELGRGPVDRLGPDIMVSPPDLDGMVARLRASDQAREIGDALLDQRLVAGIGNMWKAEGLFLGGVSPWTALADVADEDLRRVLSETARAMRAPRARRDVYARAGRPCRRCATPIESRRQGDDARTAYWCPACQPRAATASAWGRQAGTAGAGS